MPNGRVRNQAFVRLLCHTDEDEPPPEPRPPAPPPSSEEQDDTPEPGACNLPFAVVSVPPPLLLHRLAERAGGAPRVLVFSVPLARPPGPRTEPLRPQ